MSNILHCTFVCCKVLVIASNVMEILEVNVIHFVLILNSTCFSSCLGLLLLPVLVVRKP